MVTGPLKPLDAETVEKLKLPKWCLSNESLAAQLGMSARTLARRCDEDGKVADAVKVTLEEQRRRALDRTTELLFKRMEGDGKDAMTALIWFEKSRLGFSDRVTNIQEGDLTLKINRRTIPLVDEDEGNSDADG